MLLLSAQTDHNGREGGMFMSLFDQVNSKNLFNNYRFKISDCSVALMPQENGDFNDLISPENTCDLFLKIILYRFFICQNKMFSGCVLHAALLVASRGRRHTG